MTKHPGLPSEDEAFAQTCREDARRMAQDAAFTELSQRWMRESIAHRYSYNFRWLGLPIIQYPGDMIAMQELIWRVRPTRIVEAGVARGGALIFYASLLTLLGGDGRVIGIDIDIRAPNRAAIQAHTMASRIDLVDGSSIDPAVIQRAKELARTPGPVMVCLDSNHTHDHVLAELRAYAPLVRAGSYLVVFDTIVEYLPGTIYSDRPWAPGNNPMTAVRQFLAETNRFEIDHDIDDKLMVSVAPSGYLRCIADPGVDGR